MKTLSLVAMLLLTTALDASIAEAQEKVTFIPDGSSRPMTLIGEILDYNGTNLRIKPLSGDPLSIPSVSIQGIETHYSSDHKQGIELFQAGDTAAAIPQFRQALLLESRKWVDRELQAWLVKCYHRQHNLTAALLAFQKIATEDPETRHWSVAPLIWAPVSTSDEIRAQSRQWLIGNSHVSQLLGASILLLDPTYTDAAERVMKQLARDVNPNISALAKCQLWRLPLSERDVDDFTLNRWLVQLDHIPEHLRGGPKYLLASGYAVHQQYRKAVAEYLWIPLVYAENEALSARATYQAAEVLERIGLTAEANLLYREVSVRYPWSTEASAVRANSRDH